MSAQQPGGANAPRPAAPQPAPAGLDITVDRDAEIPIGVQLAWALRTRIRDGRFEPSARLPGLREVAEATGVNVNTVRAVYQRLEQEGLIDSQQGSGTFVAATPARASAVTSIAAEAAREAHQTGVDPREVAAALYVSPERPTETADEAAQRRRLLREQIAALERTLGELESKHPGVAPTGERTRDGVGPALLTAVELERVRTTLVRRLSVVQAAIDELDGEKRRKRKQGAAGERRQPARKRQGAREGAPAAPSVSPDGPAERARTGARPAPAGARTGARPGPAGARTGARPAPAGARTRARPAPAGA